MVATSSNSVRTKPRSTGAEQSVNRILDATLEALSRQGFYSLSMTDVCRIAGVARGTLYRYFPSKEVLLESLGQRTRQRTASGILKAADEANSGREALVAIINFLNNVADDGRATSMLEVEPLFFIGFLQRHLSYYTDIVTKALTGFYEEIEQGLGRSVDRQKCSEIILRLQISYIFLPDNGGNGNLVETTFDALSAFFVQPKR